MKYPKNQKFPTGLKWVIAYLIYNIIGGIILFFFGEYLGKSFNSTYLLIQIIGYSILSFGIIKLNNLSRIATIIFLISIPTIQLFYFRNFKGFTIWPLVFSGLVIYYLAKPEVERLFTKKIYTRK